MNKITVIIPVYNVEKDLRKCVESVLHQTISDINIILVDDGSKDKSGEICDFYQSKYSNIKVIHKSNAGLGLARNSGLEIAEGDYVTFLDSDDYIEPDHIENLYRNIKLNGAQACYGGHTKFNGENKVKYKNILANKVFRDEEILTHIIPRLCGQTGSYDDGIQMSVCMAMYDLNIIKKYKIRFESERVYMSEDLIFNLNYLSYAQVVSFSDDVGYMYQFNPESLSHRYLEDRFEKGKVMKAVVSKITSDLGIYDDCKQRIYNTFIISTRISLMAEILFRRINGKENSYKKFCTILDDPEIYAALKELNHDNIRVKARIINFLMKLRMKRLLWCLLLVNNLSPDFRNKIRKKEA